MLLLLLLGLPGALVIEAKLLAIVRLWQIKEYRLDRMLVHLRHESSWQAVVLDVFFKLTLLLILLLFIGGEKVMLMSVAALPALIYYIWVSEKVVVDLIYRRLPRPAMKSPRNILLIALANIVSILPFISILRWLLLFDLPLWLSTESLKLNAVLSITSTDELVAVPLSLMLVVLLVSGIILVDLLLPVQVALGVLLTGLLASLKRRRLIRQARKKMASLPDLKVVAITGSYGKSTTKEMLAQILATELQVARTPENNNTELGVALAILNEVKQNTEVFIAEMGAYTTGEIASATKVARPDISIVTAVAPQHLALFGSMEKLTTAKYEIVWNMKAEGVAIINYDNKYCQQMLKWAKAGQFDTQSFSLEGGNADVRVANVVENSGKIKFDLLVGKVKYRFATKLPSKSYLLNLCAALMAANKLGVEYEKLVNIVDETEWQLRYLAVVEANTGISYIVDNYSSNEQGFVNALQFLGAQKCEGRKVVVTRGILELGKEKSAVYTRLAKQFDDVDMLITSDKDLGKAVREQQKSKAIMAKTDVQLEAQMQSLQAGDLVLLEGRLPENKNVRI